MRGNSLFSLLGVAGAALARRNGGGAVHPFAKIKSIAMGAQQPSVISTAAAAATPPLECFQVAEPVLTPAGLTRRDEAAPTTPIATNEQKPIGLDVGLGVGPIDVGVDIDLGGGDDSACAVVLMEHDFSNSYGAPFVGNYTPPDCDFDRVVINFTAVVAGRQYDRTGVMYLGDNEVWRTSTAEPTTYGIRWEWLKDMTSFHSLWTQPQTVVFDLENIVNDIYTGIINTTLTATYFKTTADDSGETADEKPGYYNPADLIIPVSQKLGSAGMPSQFVYPDMNATTQVAGFPRNANRAVFTVDVKGQATEEFWWSNIPQSDIYTFNDTYGEYPGYSPFREAQAFVDGYLAGVYWPYPVIYTGGIVPSLNRPIVGVQAFDILEHEIDITPFLPLLCDGNAHTFSIKIVGLDDDGKSHATLSNTTTEEWYVTGKIFVWLDDDETSITTGTLGDLNTASPTISFAQTISQDSKGVNETVDFTLSVAREISLSSEVKTQRTSGTATWTQKLSYSNVGSVYGYGNNNLNTFLISGSETASGPSDAYTYATDYAFPLYSNSTYYVAPAGNTTIWAQVDQGYQSQTTGNSVFPNGIEGYSSNNSTSSSSYPTTAPIGSSTSTWRNGTANYYAPADNTYSTGLGQTRQVFSFGAVMPGGATTPLYGRDVSAYNNSVTADVVSGVGVAPVDF